MSPANGGVRGGPSIDGNHPALAGKILLDPALPSRRMSDWINLYSRTMVAPHLEHFMVVQGTPREWELLFPHLGQRQFPDSLPPPIPPRPDPRPPPGPFPAGPVPSLLGITPPCLNPVPFNIRDLSKVDFPLFVLINGFLHQAGNPHRHFNPRGP